MNKKPIHDINIHIKDQLEKLKPYYNINEYIQFIESNPDQTDNIIGVGSNKKIIRIGNSNFVKFVISPTNINDIKYHLLILTYYYLNNNSYEFKIPLVYYDNTHINFITQYVDFDLCANLRYNKIWTFPLPLENMKYAAIYGKIIGFFVKICHLEPFDGEIHIDKNRELWCLDFGSFMTLKKNAEIYLEELSGELLKYCGYGLFDYKDSKCNNILKIIVYNFNNFNNIKTVELSNE